MGGTFAPTWYYSKWGDDCQHDGGGDDHCRVFKTQDDCINYCNPWDDDADEQCEDADDPEDCNSIVTHVNTVAGWSTFFAGLMLFPTLVWVAALRRPGPASCCARDRGGVATNATPSDDGIARIARGRATSGDHGPAPDCPGRATSGDHGPAPGCPGCPVEAR